MKVLLPVDGFDDAKLIMDFVSKYRWPPDTEFRVLHVVGSNDTDAAAAKAQEVAEELVAKIAKEVRALVQETQVSSEVRCGSAVFEIVDEAYHWKANMIVMGYRTRPAVKPYMLGTVSTGVSTQASCSVAIIRPQECESTAYYAGEVLEPAKDESAACQS